MPRGLRIHLVDRGDHVSEAVGAKPYAMADGWTKAGVMKDLGAGNDQLDRSPESPRCHGHQHRLHLHRVFLAEAAADIWGDHLHAVGRQTQRGDQAVPDAFRVLSAFMHYELAVLPLCDRGNQLDWVMVLGCRGEARIDFYWGGCECSVSV